MNVKAGYLILRNAGLDWSNDKGSRLAAALAFYTLLSLAPLLVLTVAVVGLVYGEDAARGQIAGELSGVVGPEAAHAVQALIESAKTPSSGIISTVFGLGMLLLGASGVFAELQSSLNQVWEVEPPPDAGWKGMLKERFFSFAMVLGVSFLLLMSLLLSAIISALEHFLQDRLPGGQALWGLVNLAFSFATATVLFAVIFKVIPDVKLSFRHVWVGALVTAFLFTVGKFALSYYLEKSTVASAYGAAGSLVALVVWVYYSAQILLFGAEFTQAYVAWRGERIELRRNAVPAPRRHQQDKGGPPKGAPPRPTPPPSTEHPAFPRA
jgi:membrane protein